MRKPFAKHLTTFEQMLLKAEGLKWDDAVKKTFLSNSLDTTLMWALIVISICVVWWVHYLATAGQSQLKLNSEGCYSRALYNNYHHHATVSLEQHELRTHWAHHCHSYRNWRETEHNECQRRKWQNIIQNNYACTVKTMTTSLRTANFCLLYNLVSSMLSLLRLWRRQQKKRRTQKK
jgi:hypothetical protein